VHRQDILTLQVLEEIEKNGSPSQRQLAKQLNISLGLANSFIKRLAHKGYLKITTIPKNRMRYILTPKGATEKTRLTCEFVCFSYRFYKDARQKLKNLFSDFEDEGVTKIAFYGAGELAEIAYISLQEFKIALVAIFDDSRDGKIFYGRQIEDQDNLPNFDFEKILVTENNNLNFIETNLIIKGIPSDKIACIYPIVTKK
jgi:DNA-binding MarR family transcriptional regulator